MQKKAYRLQALLHFMYRGLLPDLHQNNLKLKTKNSHPALLGKNGRARHVPPIKANIGGATAEFQDSADGVMYKQNLNGSALPAILGRISLVDILTTSTFRVNADGELPLAGQDTSDAGHIPVKHVYLPRQVVLRT